MDYIDAFKANTELISALGERNAYLVWVIGMYLEEPDLEALASEALTDGTDDKKIDFIYLDKDAGRIIFAQGYYSSQKKDSAPANKASDLNTASAWLISGNLDDLPYQLRPSIEECRESLKDGEVHSVDLLYIHNLPESVNVAKELQTVAAYMRSNFGENSGITITERELGLSQIEHIFSTQESNIEVKDEIKCPAKIQFTHSGPKWEGWVLTVPGSWLHGLFTKYGDYLFSANYRGFLGISKRRRINTGIRSTAEAKPQDFWVFNNGITLLTYDLKPLGKETLLSGISVINGAQTTGSIGSVDTMRHALKDLQVLCRIIKCSDPDTIGDIIKFNNTQNEIMTWDQYSKDPDQSRIEKEFSDLGHKYSRKRGFRPKGDSIGIEDVSQSLVAFTGRYQDANRGKNRIFERKLLYNLAFSAKKARHILFVYALSRAIDERRIELKNRSNNGTILDVEEQQLRLLRNLRFKYFFLSIIAKCLETILGKKVNKETIAFSPDAAKKSNNSIIELTAIWIPIVETVLALLATQIEPEKLSERISDENAFEQLSKTISGLLYAAKVQSTTLMQKVSEG